MAALDLNYCGYCIGTVLESNLLTFDRPHFPFNKNAGKKTMDDYNTQCLKANCLNRRLNH
jgi:hypothetical protein